MMKYSAPLCIALLILLPLDGCQYLPAFGAKHPTHKTAKAPKTSYKMATFIEHISLARLALAVDSDDISAAADDLDIVQAYSKQRGNKPMSQTLLILGSSQSPRKVIAPVSSANAAESPGLRSVMARLQDSGYTLHDIRLVTASLPAPTPLNFSEKPAQDIRQALDRQQDALLANTSPLPPLDEARVQLQLISFFIRHHLRDAAYLSVDNVKQLLATATRDQSIDAPRLKTLSQQLETLEGELYTTFNRS